MAAGTSPTAANVRPAACCGGARCDRLDSRFWFSSSGSRSRQRQERHHRPLPRCPGTTILRVQSSSPPCPPRSRRTRPRRRRAPKRPRSTPSAAPRLEHGVWYQATPTVDEDVVVDVTASDYGVGVLVLSGSPGSFTPLLCGPGRVSGPVTAGQSYYILLFGDGTTTATSGNLVVQFAQAVPAPTIALTIDPRGTVDKQGNATISGTAAAPAPTARER